MGPSGKLKYKLIIYLNKKRKKNRKKDKKKEKKKGSPIE